MVVTIIRVETIKEKKVESFLVKWKKRKKKVRMMMIVFFV